MVDSAQVFWEWATANGTDLYSLVGARVWRPVAHEGWKNTEPAVVYGVSTETHHAAAETVRVTVTCKCYGGSALYRAADVVYRALKARFRGVRGQATDSGHILRCDFITGTTGLKEPQTGYPYAVAMFELELAES